LMRGFTTVRDMAGPTFGIKRAIETGVIPGPRVYPSGALISQTAGMEILRRCGAAREESLGFYTNHGIRDGRGARTYQPSAARLQYAVSTARPFHCRGDCPLHTYSERPAALAQ
jgi:imidazolonepropionase-like amidohydrolase